MLPKPSPEDSDPSQQADFWLALSHSPLFDAEQQQALQNWLANSPENQQAWQKAQDFWQLLSSMDSGQIAKVEQHFHIQDNTTVAFQRKTAPRRFNPAYLSAAACLLLGILFSLTWWPEFFADFTTAKGEQRLVTLSDGSSVLLNTTSALSVDYTANGRNLTLYSGEAYFIVTSDASRPFTVHTQSGEVRALGTAFDVKQLDDGMMVTVYQHAVRVTFKPNTMIGRLTEGKKIEFSQGRSQPVTTVDLNQAKAWREHRLVFKNQPLQQVIDELERYRPGNILITNNALAQHRVTGIFDPRDTEAALAVIEKTLGIKEYRLTDRLVWLTPSG
jgi:transmembrane sensor